VSESFHFYDLRGVLQQPPQRGQLDESCHTNEYIIHICVTMSMCITHICVYHTYMNHILIITIVCVLQLYESYTHSYVCVIHTCMCDTHINV